MPLIQADESAIISASGRLCDLRIDANFGLSAILNLINFQNFGNAIGNGTCCDLVTLIPQAINTIMQEITGILDNIASIVPMLGLLIAPTNLAGVIKWVLKLIEVFIGPYLVALIKKIAQLAGVVGEVASVASSVTNALSDLGGCANSFLPAINLNIAPLNVPLPGGNSVGHGGFNLNIPGSS